MLLRMNKWSMHFIKNYLQFSLLECCHVVAMFLKRLSPEESSRSYYFICCQELHFEHFIKRDAFL